MSSIAAQCCDAGKGGYSLEALLVDIQRGSLHDGPGVRTTFFFKGCPLRCRWCHNPESQNPVKQLSFHREKCVGCGRCETACHSNVHWLTKTGTEQFRHQVYFEHCQFCGKCLEQCPTKALKIIGTPYTEEELLKIALLDRAFYEHSGGGITCRAEKCCSRRILQPPFFRCAERRICIPVWRRAGLGLQTRWKNCCRKPICYILTGK